MNKDEVKNTINKLNSIRPILNELENKARRYKNQGDVNKDYRNGKITTEERNEMYESKKGKMPFDDQEPFFSFGYMISEFIDELGDIDETRMFFNN